MIVIEDGEVYIAILGNRQHVGFISFGGWFVSFVDMPGLGNEVGTAIWRLKTYGPFFFQDRSRAW